MQRRNIAATSVTNCRQKSLFSKMLRFQLGINLFLPIYNDSNVLDRYVLSKSADPD